MKKIALLFLLLTVLSGCKTSEENYRASYETAIAYDCEKATEGVDSATYNKILEQQKPKQAVVGNDTVRVSAGYAWQFYGDDVPLKKYNVVVGAMKQNFNAKAMCDRLRTAGCQSYVIADQQKNFYVIAAGFNNEQMAADYIKNIKKHIPFKLPIPEPYIYNTSRIYVKQQ